MATIVLNYEKAETIRRLFREGKPGKEIAHQYGVTKSTISMVVNDKIWRTHECTTRVPAKTD